jgi:hypothetical protein
VQVRHPPSCNCFETSGILFVDALGGLAHCARAAATPAVWCGAVHHPDLCLITRQFLGELEVRRILPRSYKVPPAGGLRGRFFSGHLPIPKRKSHRPMGDIIIHTMNTQAMVLPKRLRQLLRINAQGWYRQAGQTRYQRLVSLVSQAGASWCGQVVRRTRWRVPCWRLGRRVNRRRG